MAGLASRIPAVIVTRALALLIMTISLVPIGRAEAGSCVWTEVSYFTNGQVITELEMSCDGAPADSNTQPATTPVAVTTPVGSAACSGAATQFGLSPEEFCVSETEEQLTGGLVAAALRRIPLPPSDLMIQPPNGRTLVNFDTNFYTDTETFTRTLTLLGRQVTLRITPASYAWRFGDGASATTTGPGAAYPALDVTHDYARAGTVRPAVDTTYTADFRVGQGAWQPVPGTVTIAGEVQSLDVVEATPTLVGYE